MPDTHPEHTYLVARVIAPWGLNGDVTLEIISTNPDRFRRGSVMFTGDRQRLTVGQVRQVSNKVVVGFREVQTREGAEALQGAFLHVPEADLPVLAPDSYYHHQILGLRVRTTDGRDLGEVTDKGSINQRAVLQHRAALVEALYTATDPDVILPTIP